MGPQLSSPLDIVAHEADRRRLATRPCQEAPVRRRRWLESRTAASPDDIEKHENIYVAHSMARLQSSVFSVRAMSYGISPTTGEKLVLVAVDDSPTEPSNGDTKWLHMQHRGISFETFLNTALDSSGLERHVRSGVLNAFHSVLPRMEKSFVFGRYFPPIVLSRKVMLPRHATSLDVMFMAIPYFLLSELLSQPLDHATANVHPIRALVQSQYHVDSSTERETQQAIRRLHHHLGRAVVHVPQLWLVTLGSDFFATCSPTPVYDHPNSSLVTCCLGKCASPSIVKVTFSTGVFFCLERASCMAWLVRLSRNTVSTMARSLSQQEFLAQVRHAIRTATGVTTDIARFSFKLQHDHRPVTAKQWPDIIRAQPENGILGIVMTRSPPTESSMFTPVAIPLESSADDPEPTGLPSDRPGNFRASNADLSPLTLDTYQLPWHFESQNSRKSKGHIVVERALGQFDRKILLDHTRRCKSTFRRSQSKPLQKKMGYMRPFYEIPDPVREALRSLHNAISPDVEEGSATLTTSIFAWPVFDPKGPRGFPTTASLGQIRVLVAHLHFEILFHPDTAQARSYNSLPLCGESDVSQEFERLLREGHVTQHQKNLLLSFSQRLSRILELFIPADYDCIVKGKIWAAVNVLTKTFQSRFADDLFSFQCDISAIPLVEILRKVQSLQEEVLNVKRDYYIPASLVKAFLLFVLALAEAARAASTLMAEIDEPQNGEESETSDGSEISASNVGRTRSSLRRRVYELSTSFSETDYSEDESRVVGSRYSQPPVWVQGRRSRQHIAKLSSPTKSINAFPRQVVIQFFHVVDLIDAAQDELVRILQPDNNEEPESDRMMDRGKLIGLVMESILQGHSSSAKMPKLDLEEVYVNYTSQLRFNIRNNPSRSHLFDLNLLREELDIVIATMKDQLTVLGILHEDGKLEDDVTVYSEAPRMRQRPFLAKMAADQQGVPNQSTLRLMSRLTTDLEERLDVFQELRDQVTRLETLVVQWSEMKQEDHGKAILVFTIVSTIFLPMSFVTSYLGMNTSDIRNMTLDQGLYWEVATPFTITVVCLVLVVAYNSNWIMTLLSSLRNVRNAP